jgi:O-methyltransferase involved in polyketide biosynthesis
MAPPASKILSEGRPASALSLQTNVIMLDSRSSEQHSQVERTNSKVLVNLTGAQETLLATLYCKWLDASQGRKAILNDRFAGQVLRKLNFDFAKLGMNYITAATLALRARNFDDWTVEFCEPHLQQHREVTVLHLGCGLDTRPNRIEQRLADLDAAFPPRVHWIDVDLDEVTSLRSRVVPTPLQLASYRTISTSVTATDPAWLYNIEPDKPALVLMEGLSMYLQRDAGRLLLRNLAEHFSTEKCPGQIAFDALGSTMVRMQNYIALKNATGAVFAWSIDDANELTTVHDNLRLKDDTLMCERSGIWDLPWACLLMSLFCAWMPVLRYLGHDIRMDF